MSTRKARAAPCRRSHSSCNKSAYRFSHKRSKGHQPSRSSSFPHSPSTSPPRSPGALPVNSQKSVPKFNYYITPPYRLLLRTYTPRGSAGELDPQNSSSSIAGAHSTKHANILAPPSSRFSSSFDTAPRRCPTISAPAAPVPTGRAARSLRCPSSNCASSSSILKSQCPSILPI
jgi:hypothetical protein